jgi:class 3 adenylate cyclase
MSPSADPRPGGARLRPSITTVLAGVLAAVVLVAVTAVLIPEWLIARRTTFALLNERSIAGIAAFEAGVRARLDPARAMVDELAPLLERGAVPLDDAEALGPVLTGALAGRADVAAVVLIRPDESEVVARRGPAGELIWLVDRDLDDRPFAALAASAEGRSGSFWGEVVLVPEIADTTINVRRLIRRDGVVAAMLGVGVRTGDLSALVGSLGGALGGTPFILYGEDRVLAHPAMAGPRAAGSLPGLAEVGDPALAAFAARTPLDSFAPARAMGIAVDLVADALGDQDAILVTKALGGFGDTVCTIGFWLPEDVAEQALIPLRVGLAIGLGVLLLALLAAVLAGRRLARPIVRATEGAARIARLDLAVVGPLPESRVRELDEQARAFNAMLATIKAFATYVPRALVQRLVTGGAAAIPSRERDLTVMFTDIAGFTAASEHLPPSEIAAFLNRHFALLAACIEDEGGTVDKFLGDGLMAFWGAPERVKQRAARACRAALAIRAALTAENATRAGHGLAPVRVRIGIHCGRLVVGNIGAPDRLNYTVVGDAANVAQRLEQLGKEVAGDDAAAIVVSDAIVAEAGPGLAFAPLGAAAVVGRHEPVWTFRLIGTAGALPDAGPAGAPAYAARR